MCMYFSLPAQHFIQNGLGQAITAEEALEKLKYFEKIGCVHQITTLKEGETVGLCNCMPGTCRAFGVASYFNTPDFFPLQLCRGGQHRKLCCLRGILRYPL